MFKFAPEKKEKGNTSCRALYQVMRLQRDQALEEKDKVIAELRREIDLLKCEIEYRKRYETPSYGSEAESSSR